ncbi:hypothetical protein [Mycobacterium sp. 360MFTsu5.1]|uniref:hypothetical protein n=1 Tax=Mycobacterium sp. 360MFTsu5.1 TaxID=1172186 RepID=UPI0012DECA58|nr:hypothetical protein [Mycobacterium sp. 360MFTsu5.1]
MTGHGGRRRRTAPVMRHSEKGQSTTMMKLALIATTAVAATIGLAATVHADDTYDFRSPSGNVGCKMSAGGAMCEIKDYTWFIARPAGYTMGGKGNRFILDVGRAPIGGDWHSDHEFPDGAPTLGYGQKRVVGSITCDSEPTGVTCSDSTTAHFFRVSRDSYELG